MSSVVRKYVISVFFAFVVICAAVSISGIFERDQSGKESVLIVGLQSGYPPFEFVDSHGKLIGFDLEVARFVADHLHRKLVIKEMEFEALMPALKQGKIDLIMSGMNITPARLEEIALVPYHGVATESMRLLFWEKIPNGVNNLRDVASLVKPVVSVETGTVCETMMEQHPDIKTKTFHGAWDPLTDIKEGKSIAMLVEPDVAKYLQEEHPEVKSLHIPLSKDEQILGFGIGIKKSQALLIHQVYQALDSLKASGTLRQLEGKWFGGDYEKK